MTKRQVQMQVKATVPGAELKPKGHEAELASEQAVERFANDLTVPIYDAGFTVERVESVQEKMRRKNPPRTFTITFHGEVEGDDGTPAGDSLVSEALDRIEAEAAKTAGKGAEFRFDTKVV